MASSTLYDWVMFGSALAGLYFIFCKMNQNHLRKWVGKGPEKESELNRMRMEVFFLPLFILLFVPFLFVLVIAAIQGSCTNLPTKITGGWPIREGVITDWGHGYRGSKGSALIQMEDGAEWFHILNGNIMEGEMVGVTVRFACNDYESKACVLEYMESGSWVRERYLPNFGREVDGVPKTIAVNLLGGALSCGFILKKILRPEKNSFLKNRFIRNGLGLCLILSTIVNGVLVCRNVLSFQATWWGEEQMVSSQFSMMVLICLNVLFCILASQKTTLFRYWWDISKEFMKRLE